MLALFGLFIAFSGSTQDIAIDAYRIDSLADEDNQAMAAGSAMATAGWWTGYAGLGSIPFILVSKDTWQWPEVFLVLAGIMAVLMITVLVVSEPTSNREETINQIQQAYLEKLSLKKSACWSLLALIPMIFIAIFYANIGYPGWPSHFIDESWRFSHFNAILRRINFYICSKVIYAR